MKKTDNPERTEQLISRLFSKIPYQYKNQAEKALETAMNWHVGQKREGGEDHVNHVIRVATRVADEVSWSDNARAVEMTQAALLHDVLEDTDISEIDMKNKFGKRVLGLVRALSHIKEEEPDSVYFERILAGGFDAVLIKRCDKLDNIYDLKNAPKSFREQKIEENRKSLQLWKKMDPDGAVEIEKALIQTASLSSLS